MTSVVNTVTIAGPITAVFDLITSARFWPQWHPASRAVGGVTQRPYELGGVIRERGEIAGIPFDVTWKVVEHSRPSRVVLGTESPPVRIAYTCTGADGAIELQRELVYDEAVFRGAADPSALRQLLHDQSEEALQRLKELVERILREEAL
jgi:hypothetical protein